MRSTRSDRRTSTNSVVSEEEISSVNACRCSGREENARSDESGILASEGRAVLDNELRGRGASPSVRGDSCTGERTRSGIVSRAVVGFTCDETEG